MFTGSRKHQPDIAAWYYTDRVFDLLLLVLEWLRGAARPRQNLFPFGVIPCCNERPHAGCVASLNQRPCAMPTTGQLPVTNPATGERLGTSRTWAGRDTARAIAAANDACLPGASRAQRNAAPSAPYGFALALAMPALLGGHHSRDRQRMAVGRAFAYAAVMRASCALLAQSGQASLARRSRRASRRAHVRMCRAVRRWRGW